MRLARPRVSRPVDEWSRKLQRSAQQRGQNISQGGLRVSHQPAIHIQGPALPLSTYQGLVQDGDVRGEERECHGGDDGHRSRRMVFDLVSHPDHPEGRQTDRL